MMLATSLGLLALVAAPSTLPCAAALDDADEARAQTVTKALRDAESAATEDPQGGAQTLLTALEQATEIAAIGARAPELQDARTYALLALARARVTLGDAAQAEAAIDLALATAGDRALPTTLFGPGVVTLHERRSATAAERASATLSVTCSRCLVAIEGAANRCVEGDKATELRLPPGRWRVTLIDAVDPKHTRSEAIELDEIGRASLVLPPRTGGGSDGSDGAPRRKLPRWAGILGVSVGVGLAITGAVLLGLDGRCPDGSDPRSMGACTDVLATGGLGIGLLAGGAAAAIGFAIPLAIGERRAKRARAGKTAAIRWRGAGFAF
ncbi:MAG: hypothetical protein K1X88_34085 [Nannocystaceae bacterium]|nr:hypothetical protein [Nannocystaceae bacterium]